MGKGGEGARQEEPLLMDNPERFCMFPVKYKEIWEFYKKAEASFWTGDGWSAALAASALAS